MPASQRTATGPPTICKCGRAKSYHRPQDHRDHEYEPRYEPTAWREGYRRGAETDQRAAPLDAFTVRFEGATAHRGNKEYLLEQLRANFNAWGGVDAFTGRGLTFSDKIDWSVSEDGPDLIAHARLAPADSEPGRCPERCYGVLDHEGFHQTSDYIAIREDAAQARPADAALREALERLTEHHAEAECWRYPDCEDETSKARAALAQQPTAAEGDSDAS